jgi:glycosyltransferase involved in cell wall biosynthesis
MQLSICIPTYNRKKNLNNCLNSILISKKNSNIKFEVCVSDNCSEENIEDVILEYSKNLNIKFKKNSENFGLGRNIIESVSMASGKFVWILGNDDLILSNTLSELEMLLEKNNNLDFFFINSFNLKSSEVFKHAQPFKTKNLPNNMKKFSSVNKDKIVTFEQLIDPEISFDFLLGLYLSIFKRDKWNKNLSYINQKNLNDKRTYSTFENTCPHIAIFANNFFDSKCYIKSQPLSVNLSGEREWVDLYSFIELVRIPETLDFYFKSGLSFKKYYYCKNYSLRNFIPLLLKVILKGKKGGLKYIKIFPHIIKNLIFLNFYFSPMRYIFRKIFIK